jgi:YggT family protein
VEIVLQQFIWAVATVLDNLLWIYFWIVFVAALLSWVNPDPSNPIVRFLRAVTEPVLYRVRRTLPFVFAGGIDFSPLVVLLAIKFLQVFVVGSLLRLAQQIAVSPVSRSVLG